MVDIVRYQADLLAFLDPPAIKKTVRIHRRGVHVHVTEAQMLVGGVDLECRRLGGRSPDDRSITNRHYRLLPRVAKTAAIVALLAGRRPKVLTLMAISGRALSDIEATRLAEIVLPGIAGVAADDLVGLVLCFLALVGLRMGEYRRRGRRSWSPRQVDEP